MSNDWRLVDFIPVEVDDLLELEPDEIAEFVLRFAAAKPPPPEFLRAYDFGMHHSREGFPPERQKEVAPVLAEAWAWLVRECLLIPDLGDTNKGFLLSRRGRRLVESGDFAQFRSERSLQRDELHPRLRKGPYSDFIRGDWDGAVFKAMREVEIAVRETGGYANSDLGTDLMRKAFHTETGRLSDPGAEAAEREATSHLFAGAIGLFKNPSSHRFADLDAKSAAEIVQLASYLLRIVEDRHSASASASEAMP